MKPYPVLIEWGDAADVGEGWMALKSFRGSDVAPCGVVSVGWLVSKSKSAVLLALSVTEFDDARNTFVVPRACIRKMVRLKP
jgi:hypothetical protein